MSSITKISWTGFFRVPGRNLNAITGCTFVSAGCFLCYALRESYRWMCKSMKALKEGKSLTPGLKAYLGVVKKTDSGEIQWTGKINFNSDAIQHPLKTKEPTCYFVNSMSDIFHEKVQLEWLQHMFNVFNQCPQHIFQILTKRSSRLIELSPLLNWSPNIWMGVSVENKEAIHRIDDLRKTGAKIKFLSLEPLIGPLNGLDYSNINWCIVGSESGPKARFMDIQWAINIRKECEEAGVAFFMKQICEGGFRIPEEEFPKSLQVWEYPKKEEYIRNEEPADVISKKGKLKTNAKKGQPIRLGDQIYEWDEVKGLYRKAKTLAQNK